MVFGGALMGATGAEGGGLFGGGGGGGGGGVVVVVGGGGHGGGDGGNIFLKVNFEIENFKLMLEGMACERCYEERGKEQKGGQEVILHPRVGLSSIVHWGGKYNRKER